MAIITSTFTADWGKPAPTLAYKIVLADGTVAVARTAVNIQEVAPDKGQYYVNVARDTTWAGMIVWDDGTDYIVEAFNPITYSVTDTRLGPGEDRVTITVTDNGGLPIADADVWITSDSAGTNVIAGTLQTDSQGHCLFMLRDGTVYYLWAQKDGKNSIEGLRFTAEADA